MSAYFPTRCFLSNITFIIRLLSYCGLGGPGIESRWGARFSAPVQTGPGAHPASCTMGTVSLPGVKSGRGVTLTPHCLLVLWSRKSRAISLFPYGPYGLYRASVLVQGCTLPFFTLLSYWVFAVQHICVGLLSYWTFVV